VKICEANKMDDIKMLFEEMKVFRERLDAATSTVDVPPAVVEVNTDYFTFQKKVLDYVKALYLKMESITIKQDELDAYSRRNCLLVHGIKEVQNEDSTSVVLDLLREKGIADLSAESIDRSHRLGPSNQSRKKPRPIIIKFCSYAHRRIVYSNKKKLKDSGITITEQLTGTRMEILRKARTRFSHTNIWTSDGTIIILHNNQRHRITTHNALNQLLKKYPGEKDSKNDNTSKPDPGVQTRSKTKN